MSILAQIGIVILIVCIVLILIRSNKTLEEVSEEGEHFVDEWAMRQQRKEERAQEKEEEKRQKKERIQEKNLEKKKRMSRKKKEQTSSKRSKDLGYETDGNDYGYNDVDQESHNRRTKENIMDEYDREERMSFAEETTGRADILSMDKYRNPHITLVELDENHRTIRRIPVTKLPFTIGRSKENMLELDDLCVARKHCRIVEKNGVFLLEDVGTANKLYARGEITDQVVLEDQMEVYIGNVELRVEMGVARSEHTQLYGGNQRAKYYE